MLNLGAYNRFSDKFSDLPNTFNHLNLKLLSFVSIRQVLNFEFLKFRFLEILNFHPCSIQFHVVLIHISEGLPSSSGCK